MKHFFEFSMYQSLIMYSILLGFHVLVPMYLCRTTPYLTNLVITLKNFYLAIILLVSVSFNAALFVCSNIDIKLIVQRVRETRYIYREMNVFFILFMQRPR